MKLTRLTAPYLKNAVISNIITEIEYKDYMNHIDVYGLNKMAIKDEFINELFPNNVIENISSPYNSNVISKMVVMFVDMVDYTTFVKDNTLDHVINYMDTFFSTMDMMCNKYGIGKVETIGDAYLIVSECPIRTIQCAIQMNKVYKDKLRIGIHCGPIASCVLGIHKLRHAYVGHPVNVAARLEATSQTGRIHVSKDFVEFFQKQTHDKRIDEISFEDRGMILLKGVGEMQTYFVV